MFSFDVVSSTSSLSLDKIKIVWDIVKFCNFWPKIALDTCEYYLYNYLFISIHLHIYLNPTSL